MHGTSKSTMASEYTSDLSLIWPVDAKYENERSALLALGISHEARLIRMTSGAVQFTVSGPSPSQERWRLRGLTPLCPMSEKLSEMDAAIPPMALPMLLLGIEPWLAWLIERAL
jgi:hypothetical protein